MGMELEGTGPSSEKLTRSDVKQQHPLLAEGRYPGMSWKEGQEAPVQVHR